MRVDEILKKKSGNIITIQPDQTLQEASRVLAENRIGAVIVVDGAQTPVGILSERDIVRQIAAKGQEAVSLKISDVMTKDLIIALPEDEIAYLSNTMTVKRIRHLPVLSEGKLIGMISIGDVVKAQLDYYEGEAHTLRQYITGEYT